MVKAQRNPYQLNGVRTSEINRDTWSDFEDVCKMHEESGYSGIGCVFSADDPYTGVDMDNCVINGEFIQEESAKSLFSKNIRKNGFVS